MTVWEQVGREIEDFLGTIRTLPVSSPVSSDVVRHAVESRVDFSEPVPLPDLTRLVSRLLRQYAVHVTHPRYFGLFNPSVSEATTDFTIMTTCRHRAFCSSVDGRHLELTESFRSTDDIDLGDLAVRDRQTERSHQSSARSDHDADRTVHQSRLRQPREVPKGHSTLRKEGRSADLAGWRARH